MCMKKTNKQKKTGVNALTSFQHKDAGKAILLASYTISV